MLSQTLSAVQVSDSLEQMHRKGLNKEAVLLGESFIKTHQEHTLDTGFAHILLNIGVSYANLEAFYKAAHYNKRGLGIYEQLQDSTGI